MAEKVINVIEKMTDNEPEDHAHLKSAVYTNKHVWFIENSPSIGADEALGPLFSE